jgi:hypothetical protein
MNLFFCKCKKKAVFCEIIALKGNAVKLRAQRGNYLVKNI